MVISPIQLQGNWKKGLALAVHTIKSVYSGVDEYGRNQYDTTRSEIGQLVYQLKYQKDNSVIHSLVNHIIQSVKDIKIETMDYIVPVPPSRIRDIQPVMLIAHALGKKVNVPVLTNILKKSDRKKEKKNVDDSNEKVSSLRNLFELSTNTVITNKNILLVDDLYDSGETLQAITDILYKKACVKDVYVLTMTKSRAKK